MMHELEIDHPRPKGHRSAFHRARDYAITASSRITRDKRLLAAVVCFACLVLWLAGGFLLPSTPSPARLHPIATPPTHTHTFSTSPIMLVSAFFPLPTSKHTPAEYASWLKLFLGQVTTPMVIYTTKGFASVIEETRGELPIVVDTQFESPFEVPPLRGLEERYQLQHDTLDPERKRHSAALYATWNSKAWLLEHAATRYAGNHMEWFFWADAGGLRESHTFANWPDVDRIETIFHRGEKTSGTKMEDLFFIPIFDAPQSTFKTRNWKKEDGPLDLYMMSEGSFFGGKLPSIKWWSSTFYALHDHYLSQDRFVGKDQNLFNSILFLHPTRFLTVWPRDPQAQEDQSAPESSLALSGAVDCSWDPWYYYIYWLAADSERQEMRTWMTRQYEALSWIVRLLARIGLRTGNIGRGECRIVQEWTFDGILRETVGRQ